MLITECVDWRELSSQKDVAVGIVSAQDAVACMQAGNDAQLQSAITAASTPLTDLATAGEGVLTDEVSSMAVYDEVI